MHKLIAMFALLFVSLTFTNFVTAQTPDSATTASQTPIHGFTSDQKWTLSGVVETGLGFSPNRNGGLPITSFGQGLVYYGPISAGIVTLPNGVSGFFARYKATYKVAHPGGFYVGLGVSKKFPALYAGAETEPFRFLNRDMSVQAHFIMRRGSAVSIDTLIFQGIPVPAASERKTLDMGTSVQLLIPGIKIPYINKSITVVPTVSFGGVGDEFKWSIGVGARYDFYGKGKVNLPKLGKVDFGKTKETIAKTKEAAKQAKPAVKSAVAGKDFQLANLKTFTLDGAVFTVSKTEKIPSVPTARKIITDNGEYFVQVEGETVTIRLWGNTSTTFTITKRADDGSTIEAANGGNAAVLRFK